MIKRNVTLYLPSDIVELCKERHINVSKIVSELLTAYIAEEAGAKVGESPEATVRAIIGQHREATEQERLQQFYRKLHAEISIVKYHDKHEWAEHPQLKEKGHAEYARQMEISVDELEKLLVIPDEVLTRWAKGDYDKEPQVAESK